MSRDDGLGLALDYLHEIQGSLVRIEGLLRRFVTPTPPPCRSAPRIVRSPDSIRAVTYPPTPFPMKCPDCGGRMGVYDVETVGKADNYFWKISLVCEGRPMSCEGGSFTAALEPAREAPIPRHLLDEEHPAASGRRSQSEPPA